FDADGNPTKAALGFASSVNANIEDIGRLKTDKGEWLAFNLELAGQTLDKVLAEFIDESLKKLPIPKRMRWGDSDVEFVRPVHWSVVLHGNKTIKLNVLGIATGNLTQGHRFHCDSPLILTHADEYETALAEQGHVVADFDQRREQITDQLAKLEAETNGHIVVGEALLNEVTALVELPHALLG
ncbi:MAG: glycine--tRNA ligase subunit beta, partial [Arenicellales bacterium WSBS_2016_MAG_OTU3]